MTRAEPEFRVTLRYDPETWAVAPDGGRAPQQGAFVAELAGSPASFGIGRTVREAIERLAVDLVASIDADGYPVSATRDASEFPEAQVVRLAEQGTLVDELIAAADEPIVDEGWEPPSD